MRITPRSFLTTIAVLLTAAVLQAQAAYVWTSVQIQGGGYVPGVSFHPSENNLAYIRTDVGGAYRLEAGGRSWLPLNDTFTDGYDMGSIAIGLDESDPDMLYVTGGLYLRTPAESWCGNGGAFFRSANRGLTWTRGALNSTTVSGTESSVLGGENNNLLCLGGNAAYRGTGNRIAANGNTIYLATDANGLIRSTDKGDTWSTIAASTFSNTSGVSAVLFDKDGDVYAAPFSGGLFKKSDADSWGRLGNNFTGVVYQMSYSAQGNVIWLTTNTGDPLDHSGVSGGSVYKYDISSDVLTQVTTLPEKGGKNYGYIGVNVNPKDAQQILISTGGWWKGTGSSPLDGSSFIPHEEIFMSLDGGSTWKALLAGANYDLTAAYNAETSNPHWLSALAVNPNDADHVIFGTGYGVWSTFNAKADKPTWEFTSHGIEETVPLGLVSTKYGAPLVSVLGDIDGFYHESIHTPPKSRHKLQDGVNEAGTNYDIDYAGQDHKYMVRIHKHSATKLGAYSEDGGKTWKNFGSHPPLTGNPGEDNFVAVSADASAIVWNMAANGVYYSINNGATWTASSASANLLKGFRPVADKVTPGMFYIYNAGTGVLYKSTDNGANWTAVNSNLAAAAGAWGYRMFRLFASPDNAGELWVTQGANGAHHDLWFCNDCSGIKRSTDGGATFTDISGMYFARSIGFGRGGTPENPSAVYAVGVSSTGQSGVFRSDNNGGSWTRINTDATMYGEITMVIGDPCVYSRVYLGTSGRGIITGIDAAVAEPCDCEDRIDYGSTNPVRNGRPGGAAVKRAGVIRQGNILKASAPIKLYTLTGKLIASSKGRDKFATLSLTRIPNGVYIAKSGASTLRVNVRK